MEYPVHPNQSAYTQPASFIYLSTETASVVLIYLVRNTKKKKLTMDVDNTEVRYWLEQMNLFELNLYLGFLICPQRQNESKRIVTHFPKVTGGPERVPVPLCTNIKMQINFFPHYYLA